MEMAGFKRLIALMVFVVPLALSGEMVEARVQHHVVGDDRGWDPSNDLSSWSSGRFFKDGDMIWFAYSAAEESVVELESIKELLSCNLKNPIKMYTQGLDKVTLDGEGSRYFASGNEESCKKGLKLHVNVQPKDQSDRSSASSEVKYVVPADGPTLPSGSQHFSGLSFVLLGGLLLCYLGFY